MTKNYFNKKNIFNIDNYNFILIRKFSLSNYLKLFSLVFIFLASENIHAQGNDCISAVTITVNAAPITGLINNTVVNDPTATSCITGSILQDGWYKFVATGSTANVTVVSSNRQLVIYAYSGSCGVLAQISCANSNTTAGGQTETMTLTGLIATNTYFVRLGNSGGGASMTINAISVSSITVPVNDDCSSAIPLVIGSTCNFANYTNANATASSGVIAPTCGSYSGGDVWFSVVVPANGIINVDTQTGVILDSGMSLYSGSCGGLVLLSCDDDSSANGAMSYISQSGLTPGQTIYIRVWEFGNNNNGTFGICITSPSACISPLTQSNNFTLGTVTSSSIVVNFMGSANEYLVIQSLTNTLPSNPINGVIYNSTNIGTLGAGLVFVQSNNSTTINNIGLSSSTQYYYFVYAYNNTNCFGGPVYNSLAPLTGNGTTLAGPINDNCSGAILLNVNSSCNYVNYSNNGASSSTGITAPGCANYAGGDVWFSVIVPATGIINVDLLTGVILDSGLALYTGTCGSLVLLNCDDDSSANGAMSYISQSGLTPGQTIYIRVWEYGNDNNGTFGICITSPTCVTAILNSTINITQTTATISWTPPVTIPSNGYQYFVSTSSTNPVGAGIATNSTSINLTGLIANTTYYVFVRSDCSSGDFSPWSPFGTFTTGYCPSTSTSSAYYISNFSTTGGTVNITNNASGYSVGGYGNFTSQNVSQINYGSVSFSTNFVGGTFGFNIWVDWNDDMDFVDPGELVYIAGSYLTNTTGTINVPATAPQGNHRMRIRANYLSTNPNACGSITSGETEDYTFTVLPPLPCSGNPSNIIVNITSQTTSTVNWTAGSPVPINGYQYFLSLSNVSPSSTAAPTGFVGAGITTLNLSGLIAGTSYSIWVRSNCGGSLGQGVWVGPINFHQPNCFVGNGLGTSTLGCPNVISGGLGLSGSNPAPISGCTTSNCVDLEATYLQLGQTTNYNVQSIPYSPPYQFGCLQNPVSVNVDDVWSPIINLPFNFCYYGNNYNRCLISSNGALTFDTTNNTPGGYSAWSFANNLPNVSLFNNTIFGVYQDIDPSVGGEVSYELITLNSGCRALVASWNNIPMFSSTCNSSLYTGMMVLYENTNIIEIYIKEKNVCPSWNSGNAIVGLQNANGTQAVVPPNRNGLDTDWSVTNEAWRFVPSGTSITSLKWYEGTGTSGPVIGTTDVINVCPTSTTVYTAEITYTLCNGTALKETNSTTVTVNGNKSWNGSVDADWNKPNNWTPNVIPNASDCVVIPVTANNPIISGTGYNGLAGTLSVLNNATLTVNSLNYISVTNWIKVQTSGNFIFENSASLIQLNNDVNIGNITYKRNANIRKLDYVYWSSPVLNFNVNAISNPIVPGPIYKWNTTISNPNGGQGNWENASGNLMTKAKGYIVRGPNTFNSTSASTLYGVFIGIPNNGVITMPIERGSDVNTTFHSGLNGTEINNYSDNWNLIGNPYPSSIRGSQFLFDNNSKIEGSIKLWTHGLLPSLINSPFYGTFLYNYNPSDYLTFNFTGTSCCPAAAADLFIGAGQGFFVQMKDGATATNNVTFNNNLRSASYSNNTFYRSNNSNSNYVENLERHRIWLDIIDSSNYSERTLIGYIEGATMSKDNFFDANTLNIGAMNIYSMINNEKYIIQGRSLPFSSSDEVPLGINVPAVGNYTIAINALDGLFENPLQEIYLEDTTLGIIHNIRQQPYSFSSSAGISENRFILRYTNTLGTKEAFENSSANAFIKNDILLINANQNIRNIQIFDLTGKLVKTYNPKNLEKQFSDNFTFAKSVYLAKIKLENGITVHSKLMN